MHLIYNLRLLPVIALATSLTWTKSQVKPFTSCWPVPQCPLPRWKSIFLDWNFAKDGAIQGQVTFCSISFSRSFVLQFWLSFESHPGISLRPWPWVHACRPAWYTMKAQSESLITNTKFLTLYTMQRKM